MPGSIKFVVLFLLKELAVMRSFAIIFFSLSLLAAAEAQLPGWPERAAAKHLSKFRWKKASLRLHKNISKAPVNSWSKYLLSTYFFVDENPAFDLDSAYYYAVDAIGDFGVTELKIRERMKRSGIDSLTMISLRNRIDSAVFEAVKRVNTETGYIKFLEEHPFAPQREVATKMRDEVAYRNALEKNTHEAFLEFLNKYPLAQAAPEARKKYERLLFEARTADGKLSSYEKFLHDYPETPFRPEIERQIFELFTISGDAERFISFIQLYPNSRYVNRAYDVLFHILPEHEETDFPEFHFPDSLQYIRDLGSSYLVPILHDGKFGFINKDGLMILPPVLPELDPSYLCGNVTEDVIVAGNQILTRNGGLMYQGEIEELDELGAGFLMVRDGNCNVLIHKSGWIVDECVEDAKILEHRFLAVFKDSLWSLVSFGGRQILPEIFQEIKMHGNVLMLKKETGWKLLTLDQLLEFTDTQKFVPTPDYDEVKPLPKGELMMKTQTIHSVVNQHLLEIVPASSHEVEPNFFGFTAKSADGVRFFASNDKTSSLYKKIAVSEPWVMVNSDSLWRFFRATDFSVSPAAGYDSVMFYGPFLLAFRSDSAFVHFTEEQFNNVPEGANVRFIPGKDSTAFLMIESEGKKSVYDKYGAKLFTVSFDQIEHAGLNLFIVSKKEKKGLLNASGKLLLPVEYDAIGTISNNRISLLREMKFGLYEISSHSLIRPQYDKNLVAYAPHLLVAFRDGHYGLIGWDNKPVTKFEYDEVISWTDSTAWMKQGASWSLMDIATQSPLMKDIVDISFVRDTPHEKLAIVRTRGAYGVLSNLHGTVIPISFSDLVNVGSKDEPLYFTEKHVAEAAIFVVIYYDRYGRFIRREIYSEAEDYEKIYCPDN